MNVKEFFEAKEQAEANVKEVVTAADFCMTAQGCGMEKSRIYDGDTVLFKRVEAGELKSGDVVAVLLNGAEEVICRKVFYSGNEESPRVCFTADDPKIAPIAFEGEEIETFCIIGKAVAVYSDL
ncbi:MAG: S24 family peptidase [Clostridia bacterium]|nr:S24 family peptidase [Clostridia bacterium]